jgi:hypothetical protein
MVRSALAIAAALLVMSIGANCAWAQAQTLQSLETEVSGAQSADQTQTQATAQQVTSGCNRAAGFAPRGLSTPEILQPPGFRADQTAVTMQGDIHGKAGPRC